MVAFFIGILRTFVHPVDIRRFLKKKNSILGHVYAVIFGMITPFCSCSAVPMFIGFLEAGIPLGISFSFLIASPLINEVALVLLFTLFGWEVALLYGLTGFLLSVFSGWILGRLNLEKYMEKWIYQVHYQPVHKKSFFELEDRIDFAWSSVKDVLKRTWVFILFGIALGSLIQSYVPDVHLAFLMEQENIWSIPLSVLIGMPMYSSAIGVLPIAQSLFQKGAALGSLMAFVMSITGISIPQGIILRKVMKTKLIAIYFSIVTIGIIIVGLLLNLML